MRLAVCEDSADDANHVLALLSGYAATHPSAGLTTDLYTTPDALLACPQPYDIYLLDILMAGKTGIELARELRRRGCTARLLFLTSSPDYALPAFAVHASDYLLKPVSAEQLTTALDAACAEWQLRQNTRQQTFSFRAPGGLHTALVSDILYVEIVGHAPIYHLVGRVVRGSELRVSFEEAMAPLLSLACFLHPHRSYYVNAAHVQAVSPRAIRLNNNESVPVVRTRSAGVHAQYLNYLTEDHNGC
ncbi:MAG: LytTR family DNA-binding domain-containing protein [Gemmiger sp.]|nr:LytTR family DNA-binding domain-containing protein [Gemmiger sp.]